MDAGLVNNSHNIEIIDTKLQSTSPPTESKSQSVTTTEQSSNTKYSANSTVDHATSHNSSEQLPVLNCNLNYANELNDIENTSTKQQQQQQRQQRSNGPAAVIDVVRSTTTAHTAVDLSSALIVSDEKAAAHKTNNEYDVNGNAHRTIDSTTHKQQKLSNKIVVLLRRSKPIALVLINSILAVLIAISVCITMGFDYTIPAIVCAVIAIVASSGLWYWIYIAAVTAPRDIRYVKQ